MIAILGGGALYQYVIKPSQDAAAKAAAAAKVAKQNKQVYAVVGGKKITLLMVRGRLQTAEYPYQQRLAQDQQAQAGGGTQYTQQISALQQAIQGIPQNMYIGLIANYIAEQRGPRIGAKTTKADDAKYINGLLKSQFHNSIADFNTTARQVGMTPYEYRQHTCWPRTTMCTR